MTVFERRSAARAKSCAMAVLLCTAACSSEPEVAISGSPAQRLAHTLRLIRTATPADPKVVKVLFYGQSITSRAWTDFAAAHLIRTYPDVRFDIRNMAVGGFSAAQLDQTAARDMADFYPDLVVFHVYGDHRAYERIIRTMRSRTSAEIIVQTDHVVTPVDPVCRQGLHLTLTPPPGCRGVLWYRQRFWEDRMSGVVIPALARKYGLVIEPQRHWWNTYLKAAGRDPMSLIGDDVHPNPAGWRLMAGIFEKWFDRVAASWRGERSAFVSGLPVPAAGQTRSYTFAGNRVELVATAPIGSGVTARIDGKAPADLDGCWQDTRVSPLPSAGKWPAIRQVDVDPGDHRAERWTVRLSRFSPTQDRFHFDLTGSVTGPDGGGEADSDFTSPSGRVKILAADWAVADGYKLDNKGAPEGFSAWWDHRFACTDQPPVALAPGRAEVRHIIATGLVNGTHTLTLQLNAAAAAVTREVRVYRPPLVAD